MGLLPFDADGTITTPEGETLASVVCRVWKTGAGDTPGGQRYEYRGVVRGDDAAEVLVEQQNRILVVGDASYRVVDATEHPVMSYLELGLRRVRPNG